MSFTKIDRHNLSALHLNIKQCIQQADYIALDIEFTGLGDGKKTRVQNIEDRYTALRQVAQSYSVIAIGISIFKKNANFDAGTGTGPGTGAGTGTGNGKKVYSVDNFFLSTLCLKDHKSSPSSLSFLVDHGFDFNEQYLSGIPYMPGNDIFPDSSNKPNSIINLECNAILREIVICILFQKCPLVLHNGFLDLLFLYESFYCMLPPTLSTFITDCSEMFLGGLYDSKYISDFITREAASFLSLLFKKYQRIHDKNPNGISIEFTDSILFPAPKRLKLTEIGLAPNIISGAKLVKKEAPYCLQYANHGFCIDGKDCEKSHDLDLILDSLEGIENVVPDPPALSKRNKEKPMKGNLFEQEHSASFDAFMTGYVFGHQIFTIPGLFDTARNKIYLIGKQIPLLIEASKYAKASDSHLVKKLKYSR